MPSCLDIVKQFQNLVLSHVIMKTLNILFIYSTWHQQMIQRIWINLCVYWIPIMLRLSGTQCIKNMYFVTAWTLLETTYYEHSFFCAINKYKNFKKALLFKEETKHEQDSEMLSSSLGLNSIKIVVKLIKNCIFYLLIFFLWKSWLPHSPD